MNTAVTGSDLPAFYIMRNNLVEEITTNRDYVTTTTYQYEYNDKGFQVSYKTLRKETDKGNPIATVNVEYRITYLPQ